MSSGPRDSDWSIIRHLSKIVWRALDYANQTRWMRRHLAVLICVFVFLFLLAFALRFKIKRSIARAWRFQERAVRTRSFCYGRSEREDKLALLWPWPTLSRGWGLPAFRRAHLTEPYVDRVGSIWVSWGGGGRRDLANSFNGVKANWFDFIQLLPLEDKCR